MEVRSQAIAAAGEIDLDAGNFFMLITTSADVGVEFYKNGSVIEEATGVEAGYKASPPRPEDGGPAFDKVKITSATAQTVKWGIARGSGGYDRFSGEVDINPSGTLTTTADVSIIGVAAAAVIKAANSGRKRIHITNLAANADAVRLGDSSIGAARGMELPPGMTLTLETTAAVYGYRATTGSVAILEE